MKNLIFVCTFLLFVQNVNSTNLKSSNVASCYTQEGYFAAVSEKYLEDAVRYSIDKDYAALDKLLKARVIVLMKKGVKVHLVDTHLFSGTVEFRIAGQTEVFWTVTEGIKC